MTESALIKEQYVQFSSRLRRDQPHHIIHKSFEILVEAHTDTHTHTSTHVMQLHLPGSNIALRILFQMRSVDRVFKFIDLPSEEPKHPTRLKNTDVVIENPHTDDNWPSCGQMEVRDLTVKYTEAGRSVLQKLSFNIDGGHRVSKNYG